MIVQKIGPDEPKQIAIQLFWGQLKNKKFSAIQIGIFGAIFSYKWPFSMILSIYIELEGHMQLIWNFFNETQHLNRNKFSLM